MYESTHQIILRNHSPDSARDTKWRVLFAAASGKDIIRPNRFITILYAGVFVLAASLITLGIALIKNS